MRKSSAWSQSRGSALPWWLTFRSADLLVLRSSGLPKDPDTPRSLMHADVVVWGADQSPNNAVYIMVNLEGLWPATTAFAATTPATRGIRLITPGNNLAGPAAWAPY